MNISTTSLEIFHAVVKRGGVSKAAGALKRQPSSVTRAIQQLEVELGTPLFTRANKRLKLSAQGEIFLGYAEQMLQLASEAREALGHAKPNGLLRIGAHSGSPVTKLPNVLSHFQSVYPDLKIDITVGALVSLVSRLLEGEIEAAFVSEAVRQNGIEMASVFSEEYVLISPRHTRVQDARDLDNRPVISLSGDAAHRRRLDGWLRSVDLTPSRVMEFQSYHAVVVCVAAGTGIAIVPRSVIEIARERSEVQVSALPAEFAYAHTCLIWRSGYRSQALEALLALLDDSPYKSQAAFPAHRERELQAA